MEIGGNRKSSYQFWTFFKTSKLVRPATEAKQYLTNPITHKGQKNLEDPAIKKTKGANPIDSNITTTSSVSKQDAASCHQVPVVNLEVGVAGKLTDKLLNDQLRKAGRKEKLRRECDKVITQDTLAKKLRHLTRMTSGSLASVGQYSLSV